MKKFLLLAIISISAQMMAAQSKIILTTGGKYLTATLAENDATDELLALLAAGPLTITMDDYGGFEKVGALPQPLPASDLRITAAPGDIMLYQGDNMVIFYGTNTWSYTPLGKIDGAGTDSLREFLGNGSIELTITLSTDSAVKLPEADAPDKPTVCDLSGRPVPQRPVPPGIYIVNGRKTVIP